MNSVFGVPHPYSLPSANTPSISAKTPPKKGKPRAGSRRATGQELADSARGVLWIERVWDHVGEEDAEECPDAEQDPGRGALRSTSSSVVTLRVITGRPSAVSPRKTSSSEAFWA